MRNILPELNHYLFSLGIKIDKNEFEYQFKSHPDYPTILALSDTLGFFNISNGAMKIDKSEIDLLPDNFITILDNGKIVSHVEKLDNKFKYTKAKNQPVTVDKEQFYSIWDGFIFLIEKGENTKSGRGQNNFYRWGGIIIALLYFLQLFLLGARVYEFLYSFFISGGLIFFNHFNEGFISHKK